MNIPEEAVEAAARAVVQSLWNNDGHDYGLYVDFGNELTGIVDGEVNALVLARAALEAAYPAIRHMAAREALDGLIAKHDQSASRHPDGSAARFDEQRVAFRIMVYRDTEYPESD